MKNKPPYTLMLFGGFRLLDSKGEVLPLGARKSKALLAWLAVNPGQEHAREKLASLLWPDSEETAARHSLRQALAGLRKIIPAESGLLETSKEFISLNSELINIDVQDFEAALLKDDSSSLEKAIKLYSGEFLEGCNPHSDMFDDWGMTYRHDYNERATSAIEQRLSQQLNNHNYEQAISLAMRLITLDSVRESAYRALMTAHTHLGNHASALRWYRRCQHVLQYELEVSPDEETEALYQKLLSDTDINTCQLPRKTPYSLHLKSNAPTKDNQRILYQIEAAIEGVLDYIGGQSFLIRGEESTGKSELTGNIMALAESHGFFCCQKKLSSTTNSNNTNILKELTQSFSICLLSHSIETDIHNKTSCTTTANNTTKSINDITRLVNATASHQPILLVIEHIHKANLETLGLLANLISSAGNCSMLLLMTSEFEGEALDPTWRGAMRGAPLTTIDML